MLLFHANMCGFFNFQDKFTSSLLLSTILDECLIDIITAEELDWCPVSEIIAYFILFYFRARLLMNFMHDCPPFLTALCSIVDLFKQRDHRLIYSFIYMTMSHKIRI